MKKSLLFAFVACCAMGVNAQSIKNHISANKAEVTFAAPAFNKAAVAKSSVAAPAVAAAPKKSPAVCENTDSSHSVWGNYQEIMAFDEFTGASHVTVEFEEADGVKYAVMSGLFRGFGSEVYGIYDEEAKTITIPADSFVGTYEYQGTLMYLCLNSVEAAEEEGYFNYRGEFDEEGNPIELYPVVFNAEETEDGLTLSIAEGGWFLNAYSSLDEDAEYLGGWAADADGEILHKANALGTYWFCEVGDGGWTDWAKGEEEYYVEKYDESMMIYGVRGQYVIEISYDKGTGEAELVNQPLWYYSSQNLWFKVFGCYLEPGINEQGEQVNYIRIGAGDDFAVPGIYEDSQDYFALYALNEAGDPKSQCFYICTEPDADGYAYFDSVIQGLEIYGMCGEAYKEQYGIHSVLAPTAKAGSYNLAGQRVNTYTKGINIENGKKVVR
ncbi:MAG: hypothetical protein Q4D23_05225 [Bacteroidales bacterium]|nr:hypothetical protein [Bacteroidales bacterium]